MKKNKERVAKSIQKVETFSDLDITLCPTPEQELMENEFSIIGNVIKCHYHIDGNSIIVKLDNGEYVKISKNPKSESSFNLLDSLHNRMPPIINIARKCN